ncbi:MAG: DNA-protecting protein DprA [Proteobacteria bacterium]|nr:DNA-protecting protein DprA [Pseudomonadota bacterium]
MRTQSMTSMTLSAAEKRDWLRLSRTQNVGPVTFFALLERFGTAAKAIDAVPALARRGGVSSSLRIPSVRDAEREMEALAKLGGYLVASADPDYPGGLAALDAPPPVLFALGCRELLVRDMVGIVGARNASALGRKFAQHLAADIGSAGLVVCSGLARGIDTAAYEGSLATGTCAVLAGGIDIVYPPENRGLYDRVAHEGLVVSEMPLGQSPQARHFPRRNRIISGLSRGVVIVEAAEGSGSLITANYALEQGREIFAVPGSPLDPRAKGTNRLIRDGATLTESADDVLNGLQPILASRFCETNGTPLLLDPRTLDVEADKVRGRIVELLGPTAVEVDELVRQCGSPAPAILAVLVELELAGKLNRQPGNRVALR